MSSVDVLKSIVEFPLIFIGINDVNLKEHVKYIIEKFMERALVM